MRGTAFGVQRLCLGGASAVISALLWLPLWVVLWYPDVVSFRRAYFVGRERFPVGCFENGARLLCVGVDCV